MQLTPTQINLIKEQAIREYKLKHETKAKNSSIPYRAKKLLGKLVPINIAIGIIASAVYIFFKGWKEYFFLFLTAMIGITFISTIIYEIIKSE